MVRQIAKIIYRSRLAALIAGIAGRVALKARRFALNAPADATEAELFEKADDFLANVLAKRVRRTIHIVRPNNVKEMSK